MIDLCRKGDLMAMVLFSVAGVIGCFLFGEMIGKVCRDMNEYDSMKRRGYTLMKDDKGDDFWVGYGD